MKKTLLIAISQSEKEEEIIEVVKKANEAGAITLSITNNEESTVAIECKYDLYTNIDKSKTYISTIYLLTKLIYELTGIPELDLEEERVYEALENGLNYYDQIKEDIKKIKDNKQLIVISRGYNISLANELALNLKEKCHIQAYAYPSSELSLKIINKEIPVVLFAIDRITNENINKLLKELKKIGCCTYVITNIGDVLNNACDGINILEDNDLYAMFTAIVIMQLYTYEMSVTKN